MYRCDTYLNISKVQRFNFFYLHDQYFALQIVLDFVMIYDLHFAMGKIGALPIICDLDTNNGCLLE